MPHEIRRGEIFWVDWNPSRGSEQTGLRPALVIQNDIGNKFSSTTIVAALTTPADKQYPFLVKIPAGEGGLPKDSMINLSAILTVDQARLVKKIGSLDRTRLLEVDQAIRVSLDLKS